MGVGGSSAFNFSGQFELEVNTTSGEKQIQRFAVDTDSGTPTGQLVTISVPKQSLHLFIGGQLNIVNIVTISGSFDLTIDSTGLVAMAQASISILGFHLGLQGFIGIYGGSDAGLALDL
jgi:hypothetical protein